MQTAPAVFYEDTARHVTLATHKQAVERAIQVYSFQPAMMVKYGPVKK